MKANTVRLFVVWSALLPSAISLTAGPLDTAWLKGTTDKDPLSYRCGDDMALTIELMGVEGAIPEGEYSMQWTRTDDFGGTESGSVPLPGRPFTYRTRLDKPGFVRLTAYVVGKDGIRYEKKFIGDATTPEGRKAMNASRAERKASGDGWYIPWTESMGYYDAVNWAKRIPGTCRTNITRAGLGDYCCPPMGLAKLYNNIPGNKSIKWVQGSRHGYVPPEYNGRDFYKETP